MRAVWFATVIGSSVTVGAGAAWWTLSSGGAWLPAPLAPATPFAALLVGLCLFLMLCLLLGPVVLGLLDSMGASRVLDNLTALHKKQRQKGITRANFLSCFAGDSLLYQAAKLLSQGFLTTQTDNTAPENEQVMTSSKAAADLFHPSQLVDRPLGVWLFYGLACFGLLTCLALVPLAPADKAALLAWPASLALALGAATRLVQGSRRTQLARLTNQIDDLFLRAPADAALWRQIQALTGLKDEVARALTQIQQSVQDSSTQHRQEMSLALRKAVDKPLVALTARLEKQQAAQARQIADMADRAVSSYLNELRAVTGTDADALQKAMGAIEGALSSLDQAVTQSMEHSGERYEANLKRMGQVQNQILDKLNGTVRTIEKALSGVEAALAGVDQRMVRATERSADQYEAAIAALAKAQDQALARVGSASELALAPLRGAAAPAAESLSEPPRLDATQQDRLDKQLSAIRAQFDSLNKQLPPLPPH